MSENNKTARVASMVQVAKWQAREKKTRLREFRMIYNRNARKTNYLEE